MWNSCLRDSPGIARHLEETFIPISQAQHTGARALLEFWQKRSAAGIKIGRDIPSRAIAKHLSHLILWAPLDGGRDFVVRHMGETLRSRFGGYVVGQKMSELLAEDVFSYHVDAYRRLVAEKRADILDVVQSHNGVDLLHYELVVFPATAPDSAETWIVVGVFYF